MWELIRANQRKSIFLFVGMAGCLMLLGYLLGAAFFPPDGGLMGLIVATVVWLVMTLISLTSADSVLLAVSGAQPITHEVNPQLYNVTEEMRIAAGLPVMPRLYIMHENAPNAFATGINSNNSAIVVTSGLLATMNRDELQGVIGHEMGHILNRDVKFITLAGVILGSITLLTEIFFRGMYYSRGSSRRYSSRDSSSGGGNAQAIFLVAAIVFAILAPILTQILYYAISRRREYLADATSARLTRYPEGLASALEKLAACTEELQAANKVTAPMFIVNPIKPQGMPLSDLTATHPPIHERIRILRNMTGAGYGDYEQAFQQEKKGEHVIPPSALQSKEGVDIRPAQSARESAVSAKTQIRTAGDMFRAASGFAFVTCSCGLKFKIPPEYKDSAVECPRCHQKVEIPTAELAALGNLAAGTQVAQNFNKSMATDTPQVFTRRSNDWASVRCVCGNLIQVSPMFIGTNMRCPRCHRPIQIRSG